MIELSYGRKDTVPQETPIVKDDMPSLKDILPPPEQLVQLEPEEVGMFVLKYLCLAERNKGASGPMSRYNFTLPDSLAHYVSDHALQQEVAKVLTEGWVWLERELMIAPQPGESSGQWFFVTRRGKKANEQGNLAAYKSASRLPEGTLDPVLARKVKPMFIRGDYEPAIFQAFKEVEVRVRKASGQKCQRCWIRLSSVGNSAKHPTLCHRCVAVVEKLKPEGI